MKSDEDTEELISESNNYNILQELFDNKYSIMTTHEKYLAIENKTRNKSKSIILISIKWSIFSITDFDVIIWFPGSLKNEKKNNI